MSEFCNAAIRSAKYTVNGIGNVFFYLYTVVNIQEITVKLRCLYRNIFYFYSTFKPLFAGFNFHLWKIVLLQLLQIFKKNRLKKFPQIVFHYFI